MIIKAISFILFAMATGMVNAAELEDRINAMLEDVKGGLQATEIMETPISNIMMVELSGGQYVYVTRDAEFIFPGKMLQHTGEGLTDLTEQHMAAKRKAELERVDLDKTITFKSKGEEKDEIFVFTDVSCGYCKKLHSHIEDYNEAGVTVHYLAFPRAGVQSPAGELMSSVWCSKDQQQALTEAKQEGALTEGVENCDNPVASQRDLGLTLGVTGTPGIYDREGRHLGGYLTPEQLNEALNKG
jgi:thiol:disulfide interchange protein DsbC